MKSTLEVWLDSDLMEPTLIGTLFHDRGQVDFRYNSSWLKNKRAFVVDPELNLDAAAFFPDPDMGHFGIFLDSSPDRWGQTLMKRREALQAKDEGRTPRTLYAWDFLLGVQDVTRQGALRYRLEGTDPFLADETLSAPPLTSLPELERVACQLSAKRIDDMDALRKCLAVLVAPGASLGGARPKANFLDADGTLWIAKFPAQDDDRDVGAWEFVASELAQAAKIDVPEAKLAMLNNEYRTFCVRRFDRSGSKRRFYASAMTLLRKTQSEGTSYVEIAQFIQNNAGRGVVRDDLRQLFRRVAFNVAVGNRDDHLRNHGFILESSGWRLAPAFDVNPNVDKTDHVLNIDDSDHRPNLRTVLATAPFYGLEQDEAKAIINDVLIAAKTWRETARKAGLSRADVELTAAAFSATDAIEAGQVFLQKV